MADASHSELIAKFSNVTGVDAERAKFYLESAAWQLDVALGSFYEDDDVENVGEAASSSEPVAPAATNTAAPAKPAERSRFGTIAGIQKEPDSDEEEGQAFYAGGSEHGGGQQVLGPPRKKQSADDLVQNMFKAAKEHGAEVVEPGASSTARSAMPTFHGTGYRLGETEGTSDIVRGAPRQETPTQVDVVLKLWKNGFSVDDGPLRDYHDPANKDFLDSIHKGEVPRELLRLARGGEVNLNMEDHRTDEYVKPKVATKAFSGEGHMLGSPSPNVAAGSASPGQTQENEASAKTAISVDSTKPTTSLQIRLSDGSRMVCKFNHTHKVSDIRTYITTARPEFAAANFVLMTTFPNKELTEESQTLEEAKLLNAVIVQRMK